MTTCRWEMLYLDGSRDSPVACIHGEIDGIVFRRKINIDDKNIDLSSSSPYYRLDVVYR